jgi:hypothetical protein
MAPSSNYADVPGPGGRPIRITETEADALRVALTQGQTLNERQRLVLRCLLHHWRSRVAWRHEPAERHRKRGLGLKPSTEVVLHGGPLHGCRGAIEFPDEILCGRHEFALRLRPQSKPRRDAAPDECVAYVLDPRAHPSDRTVTYSYAADLREDVRKACTIGQLSPPPAPDEDGFGGI